MDKNYLEYHLKRVNETISCCWIVNDHEIWFAAKFLMCLECQPEWKCVSMLHKLRYSNVNLGILFHKILNQKKVLTTIPSANYLKL